MGDGYNLEPPIVRQRDVKRTENTLGITPLERQIVAVIVAGFTNKVSAEMVGVSQRSLQHHIAAIMAKLHVANRFELVLFALHNNLIDLSE